MRRPLSPVRFVRPARSGRSAPPVRLALAVALLWALPAGSSAQQTANAWTCLLDILCPDTGACRDWDQRITISEGGDGWQVDWGDADLPSDYDLVADMSAPDDAVQPARVRSLLFRNTRTQATQLITFDDTGNVVVTGHQPQAGTRVVTGLGSCEVVMVE